jgi:hypothetical protein
LENKRNLAILGVLLLALGYFFYTNVLSTGDAASQRPPAATAGAIVPEQQPAAAVTPVSSARPAAAARRSSEFRPIFRSKRPEDRVDVTTVDPRLHLELLSKLQQVSAEGTGRNLFQFGAPPPPPQSKTAAKLPREPEPIIRPMPASTTPNIPSGPPPPPPIPLKFYGLATVRPDGTKTAFLSEGDNIHIAAEGELVKKRYKIIRINAKSIVIEDTDLKRQQTLQIEPEV